MSPVILFSGKKQLDPKWLATFGRACEAHIPDCRRCAPLIGSTLYFLNNLILECRASMHAPAKVVAQIWPCHHEVAVRGKIVECYVDT